MYGSKIVIAVLISAFFQVSLGNEPTPTTAPTFNELVEKTKASATDFYNTFARVFGLPENTDLYNEMLNVSQKLQDRFKTVLDELKKHANEGNVSAILAPVKENLANSLSHLKENAPDTAQLQEKISKAIQTFADQFAKVSNEIKNENGEVQGNIKSIFESAVVYANNITADFKTKMDKFVADHATKPAEKH